MQLTEEQFEALKYWVEQLAYQATLDMGFSGESDEWDAEKAFRKSVGLPEFKDE